MNLIFFLPAPIRAYIYCLDYRFEVVFENDFDLSSESYNWLRKHEYNKTQQEINLFKLKRKLGISSLLLIRRNSDVERHFLKLENEYYNEINLR